MRYFKKDFIHQNKGIWYIELESKNEVVTREIEFDDKFNIIRKAPSKEDNYGVFTDNLNVIIKGQKPTHKEAIIIDSDNKNTEEISKGEFEKFWMKDYVFIKKKDPIKIFFRIALVVLFIVLIFLFF